MGENVNWHVNSTNDAVQKKVTASRTVTNVLQTGRYGNDYPCGMSHIAVGAYLRTLRKARGLNQHAVARLIGVSSQKAISEWENGSANMGAANLFAYTAVVGGNPLYVQRLMLDSDLTAADGEQVAAAQLALEKYGL